MFTEYQRTIRDKIVLKGEGIYTGKEIKVELEPAEPDTGIVFIKMDNGNPTEIPLQIENVIGLSGATAVTYQDKTIYLVEHLLSALHGLQIDNLRIKIWGDEIPLFDGSASLWVKEIQKVGYALFPVPKRKIRILKRYEYQNGIGKIIFEPANKLFISAKIEYEHPLIGTQEFSLEVNPLNYIKEIAFARTFGFKDIISERISKGIIKGGSLENAIVLDEKGVVNPEGLRTKDEFVRHKVLDLIGDLFTLGCSIVGKITAIYSHHKLHIEALKTMYLANLLEEFTATSLTFLFFPKKKKVS